MATSPVTPTAAQALGTAYTGQQVQNPVAVIPYDPKIATIDVPFGLMNEVLRLIQATSASNGSFQVRNVSDAALSAGAVTISGFYGLDAITGNPIFTINAAEAENSSPANGLLLSSLAAQTSGQVFSAGSFTSALDTRYANIGDVVYVGVNGGLTLHEPDADTVQYIQIVGNVQALALNGVISGFVRPALIIPAKVEDEQIVFVY